VSWYVVKFRKIPEEIEWINPISGDVHLVDVYPEHLNGEEVVAFYCRNCGSIFWYSDDTAIICPKCGSRDVVPEYV
jgi:DNA-directed RNA polymerase subunit RPC12/RpoP